MNEAIFIGVIMVVAGFSGYFMHKETLGDLTGDYYYKKLPSGTLLYVAYKDNNIIKTRKATFKDVKVLKNLNYLR